MKKALEFIKKWWAKFVALANKKAFIFSYPLGAIALLTLIDGSLLGFLLLLTWLLVVTVNKNEI
jgi:hypothetical protein